MGLLIGFSEAASAGGPHPVANHFEDGRIERAGELHADCPFLDPCDFGLDRFDAGKGNPDRIPRLDIDRQLHPAALRRKIQDIDPVAMVPGPPEVDIGAKRHAFGPARCVVVGQQTFPQKSDPISSLPASVVKTKRLIDEGAGRD